ncbi:hypothetical protein ACGF5O_22125 [Streptomyces sp. NPDC048291]|uniref:hypothetical protein n=1 Tax=Streptomyces sp. NPDC048291 TaxID=3365530 RepID=UPI00371778B8
MRATTPDAVAVAFGVLDGLDVLGVVDGLGAAEAAAEVCRALGDAVVRGLGATVRAVREGAVAFGLGAVVFPARAGERGVFAALTEALGVSVALGPADAVHEGPPVRTASSQGRLRWASFHQYVLFHEAVVARLSALVDRGPPPSGQLVQARAADGMPTAPTATPAMTIRR